MSFEARNKNGTYPFDVTDSLNAAAMRLVNSIADIKLFVYADGHLTGYLTNATATQVTLTIYSDNQLLTTCIALLDGSIRGGSTIDTTNSFVKFCGIPEAGTYNIPLLAQTLCYVPTGLQLFCQGNQITRRAQIQQYAPERCYLYNKSISFLQGRNCQVFTQDGVISFSGGAGNGLGRFTQNQTRQLWKLQLPVTERQVKRGVLSINGITPDVFLQALGELNLQFTTGNNFLTVQIQRGQQE